MLTVSVSLTKLEDGAEQAKDLQGTAEYYAPEMAVQSISDAGYSTRKIILKGSNNTKATDIWGLGYVNILGR